MIIFLGYFLLAAALGVAVWLLEVHLFREKRVSTRTSAVQENENVIDDSANTENTYDHDKSSSKNIYLNTKEKVTAGKLYESDDEFDNTKYETIDNHGNTTNNIISFLQENDKELTNVKNNTACSGYGSIEDQSNKCMFNKLNVSYDISDPAGYGLCSSYTCVSCLSLFEDKSDNSESYDAQTNEPAKDEYKNPEVIKPLFTHRKYNTKMFTPNESNYVKENVQSFMDTFEQNDCTSDDEVNYLNSIGHTSTEISDESIEKSLESNSYSSDYTESLPSTIFSNDNSFMDIKYVEDITDIAFCESDVSDTLNRAFVGE